MLKKLKNKFNKEYWPLIQKNINNTINKNFKNDLSKEIIYYHLNSFGKRIRSLLTLYIYKCYDNKLENVFPFAAAVELLHNATLIHDDIQDNDATRRGKVSLWKKYSINQAINAGDFLFISSIDVILNSSYNDPIKFKLINLLLNASYELTNGQILDIEFKNKDEMFINDYFEICYGKTGGIFKLIVNGALYLAGINIENYSKDLDEIGKTFGCIYQIRDDIVDILGKKEGRNKGSDIIDGEYTILVISALNNLDKKGKKELIDLLHLKNKDKKTIDYIIKIYNKTNAIKISIDYYNNEVKKLFKNNFLKKNKKIFNLFKEIFNYMKF